MTSGSIFFYQNWLNFLLALWLRFLLTKAPYAIENKVRLATGDIIVHISGDKIGSILLPLPPLAEQKRIVEKIEELMQYCDKL